MARQNTSSASRVGEVSSGEPSIFKMGTVLPALYSSDDLAS